MASKKFREDHCRTAFEEVKLKVMRYYLGVKRAQHRQRFGALLSSTVDKPIVEESHKKDFWAAKAPRGNRVQLEGENNLGILLVALRAESRSLKPDESCVVEALAIPKFTLIGKPVRPVN